MVQIDQYESDIREITLGVPQGSILGPVLFILYLVDLDKSSNLYKILFADDTTLIAKADNLTNLVNVAQIQLESTTKWFYDNNLHIHPQKTIIMPPFAKTVPTHSLNICNTKVDISLEPTKFLGLWIDPALNWKHHILSIANKLRQVNYNLARIKHILPTDTKLLIYNCLFKSVLEYGLVAWGSCPKSYQQTIAKLQKKAVRLVAGKKINSHTNPIFAKLGTLKLEDLYVAQCLKLREKVSSDGNASQFLKQLLVPKVHRYMTRGKTYIYMQKDSPIKQIIIVINKHMDKASKDFTKECLTEYKTFNCNGCPACAN